MRIAIVAHLKHPIAEPFRGGLEMHTHLLERKLTAAGHDVTLYAADGSTGRAVVAVCAPTSRLESDPARAATIDGVERRAYEEIVARLQAGAFDIVHCNALHPLPLLEAATLGMPMVCVLHTPPFAPFEAAVRSSAGVVTFVAVSQSLALQWAGVNPQVVDNGIDLDRFAYRNRPDAARFALWSGRIVPEKGLHLAIDAAREAGIALSIAGPRNDPAYWEREIRPRLGEGAHYLGHLAHGALSKVLGAASVLICSPRWEEPFGLVIAEALACGTPVAAFARGAIPDILDEDCGALATPDDVEDLAMALRRCLTLDRRHCRSRATALFDADLMMDAYDAIYRRAVAALTSSSANEVVEDEVAS